jgi:putative flippase GtrA
MATTAPGLYARLRPMLPELLRFAVVGGIGSIIDLGGSAVLHDDYHLGPLVAKAVAVTIASVVTYLGSKFWTFKHRESGSGHREVVLFIGLNVIGLIIAEVVIALTTYGLGLHGKLPYNAASLVGTGLATLFRFYSYRKWVFTASAKSPATAPLPSVPAVPDYPPWEFDPAFLAVAAVANPAPAAVAVTAPLLAVPTSSGWDMPAAPAGSLSTADNLKMANSWDTAPIGVWGSLAAAVGGTERPASPWSPEAVPATAELSLRQENSSQPNGRVVAAPHRHGQPAAGPEERRHTATGPIAVPPPARPSGRHRRN